MRLLLTLLYALLLVGCHYNEEDSGDGKYSYLRADFVDMHADKDGLFDYAQTDEGRKLCFIKPMKSPWVTVPDSSFRVLLLYNDSPDDMVKVVNFNPLPVFSMKKKGVGGELKNEPIGFQSAWRSKNNKYINLGLLLKTGKDDSGKDGQAMAFLCDSIVGQQAEKHVYLTLLHRQNGVPEYYTSRVFVSMVIPDSLRQSVFHISVLTYDGMIRKVLDK